MKNSKKIQSRFENLYIPEPNTGCFLWLGALRGKGYGCFDKQIASRVSYELYKGPIPEGMIVCHSCNQPSCVNPDHLFAGTYSDNTQQAVREGRQFVAVGETNGSSKLTEVEVLAIRKDTRNQYAIAATYGISQLHVSRIKRKVVWKHI